jgi:opacity protein-like surface antigen
LNQPNDRARTGRRAGARAVVGALTLLVGLSGARAAAAQTPAPRDTARADSVRADSLRRLPSDSAARDSAVARAMRARTTDGSVFDRVGVDRLRLSTVGGSVGLVWPRRVEVARMYAVHADYGEIARGIHVVFQTSYWSSRYTDTAVRGLAQAIGDALGTTPPALGRIRTSDLALATDVRWMPGERRAARRGAAGDPAALRPFLGAGFALHFLDVEGVPINDTFVEQALDGVGIGLAASTGLDVALLPNVTLTMHARYDLFSGAHFASLRAGGSYRFDATRATDAARSILAPRSRP